METFNFQLDTKHTIWHRQNIEIEAENKEEATNQLKFLAESEYVDEDELLDKNIEFGDSEWLYDTSEYQCRGLVEPNPITIEVLDGEGNTIISNHI